MSIPNTSSHILQYLCSFDLKNELVGACIVESKHYHERLNTSNHGIFGLRSNKTLWCAHVTCVPKSNAIHTLFKHQYEF